jgi:cytochrome c-type biogenesis protein CcmH
MGAQGLAPGAKELPALLGQEKDILRRSSSEDTPELRRGLADIRAAIARAHWNAGDIDAAEAYLESALDIEPQRADRWSMLGDLLQLTGEPAAGLLAVSAYEKALELEPKRDWVRAKLAAACLAQERFERAIAEFETILKGQDKPDAENLVPLTAAYAASEQPERGAAFLEETYRRGPDARFLIAAAVLRRQAGEIPQAFELLRRAQSAAADKEVADYALSLRREYGDPELSR